MRLLEHMRLGRAVKEAMDNLPEGVCFFNRYGLPVLCNHRMRDVYFRMTGKDLQSLSELQGALEGARDGVRSMPDGSVWRFTVQPVETYDGHVYTRALAADVTELRREQEQLRQANDAQRRSYAALQRLQDKTVAIAREEESLAMKMQVHNELGHHLQMIRLFLEKGCPGEEKAGLIAQQRVILGKLRVRARAEDDPWQELTDLAASLDIRILLEGEVPRAGPLRELLTLILRECLVNTVRHAHGDEVRVVLTHSPGRLEADITNNGDAPQGQVTEGGGLTSLRERIESAGGAMVVKSAPVFCLRAILPEREEEERA